ncbi:MAG: hypothetical protein ACR2PS_12900, partial [Pseudomonadales bacterium]
MKKTLYLFLLLVLLIVAFIAALIIVPMKSAPPVAVKNDFAIEHVNIVDVRSGSIKNDMAVLVADSKILNIIPSKDYNNSPEFISIFAEGKYLIPGLWDMHT